MKNSTLSLAALLCTTLAATPFVNAGEEVLDFEDLAEGFHGIPFTYHGIEFYDLNSVSGVFPSGDTFDPQEFDEVVIEDATLFYDDNPTFGSPDKTLTFGTAFVPGDNLSLGRLSNVTLDLPEAADSVTMDVAYYENGPWGGIEYHLDVLMNGNVLGSDSFVIADGGGRDNTTTTMMTVSGVTFDQVKIYATYGNEYSLPRILIDDLTLNYVGGSGPAIAIVGKCPGRLDFNVTGATPNENVAFIYAKGTGNVTIPGGNPCAGTTLGLNASAKLAATVRADGSGNATLNRNVPEGACRGAYFLQGLDLSTCATTNVEATP